jgi:hypothetical protein
MGHNCMQLVQPPPTVSTTVTLWSAPCLFDALRAAWFCSSAIAVFNARTQGTLSLSPHKSYTF